MQVSLVLRITLQIQMVTTHKIMQTIFKTINFKTSSNDCFQVLKKPSEVT